MSDTNPNATGTISATVSTPRQSLGTVLSNFWIADDIYRMVLNCPEVAAQVHPGQFVHLRMPDFEAHILRRPFSVADVSANGESLTLIYQVVGEGSSYLSFAKEDTVLDVLGPIGHGWQPSLGTTSALLVAGGLGIAPLNMLIAPLLRVGEVQLVIGAQTASKLVFADCEDPRLKQQAVTDDGSVGRKGFVTELAREKLESGHYDYIATCGPEPMQRIVAELAREFNIPCEVSLERRMACGIGACRSCVVSTTSGNKRACVDGPVFNAKEVVW